MTKKLWELAKQIAALITFLLLLYMHFILHKNITFIATVLILMEIQLGIEEIKTTIERRK